MSRCSRGLVRGTCFGLLFVSVGAAALAQEGTANGEWRHYAGDLASTRYSPLDQIDGTNFNDLELVWRMKTDNFGSQPEYNFEGTPLMVDGVVYTTAGTRRSVVAVDAGTGEYLWMHRLDEGERGAATPRRLSGRGLAYRDDGGAGQIIYVTPGYRMIALDAATGQRVSSFGTDGIVDLMQNMDQEIDPLLVRGFFRRLPDRRDIGEVEMEEGEIGAFRSAPDIFDGFVRLVGIAAGEEHARAFSGQPACDLEADPRIRSGDDGRPAGLFGDIGIGETHANISNCATGAKLRR